MSEGRKVTKNSEKLFNNFPHKYRADGLQSAPQDAFSSISSDFYP